MPCTVELPLTRAGRAASALRRGRSAIWTHPCRLVLRTTCRRFTRAGRAAGACGVRAARRCHVLGRCSRCGLVRAAGCARECGKRDEDNGPMDLHREPPEHGRHMAALEGRTSDERRTYTSRSCCVRCADPSGREQVTTEAIRYRASHRAVLDRNTPCSRAPLDASSDGEHPRTRTERYSLCWSLVSTAGSLLPIGRRTR